MSFDALMKDTAKINVRGTVSEYGASVYALGTAFKCRFSSAQGTHVLTQTGEDAVIDGFVFFNSAVAVTESDQIQINGTMYRIMSLARVGSYAEDHHFKAAVRRV